ncbi:hypothetical protein Geob_2495 [Geotalea daltonii FRC-32]|uniref:Uncharacterized protein n=1 Tax=Geotalea daltonii (strain DSM 22248 / JCM 15807 / FRC-32) TaxID=316067 RepID=B9M068_GEODF|nr:hypothetical protein Geob_2495 [Geotalea daltonii FRC-32]
MSHPSFRHASALLLVILYGLVVMLPLAPFILHSPALAHVLTGECSGDCRVCGCESERSANRTCCCWQKKGRMVPLDNDCRIKHDQHEKPVTPVLSCTSPCGKLKQSIIFGGEKYEQPPSDFVQNAVFRCLMELASHPCGHPPLRYLNPPDPPPKLLHLS